MSGTLKRSFSGLLKSIPENHEFPIQNLPFACGVPKESKTPNCISRIGDKVIDLKKLEEQGVFRGTLPDNTFSQSTLNKFMELSPSHWKKAREILTDKLTNSQIDFCIRSLSDFKLTLPAQIGDYTDFYSCKNHRDNCGKMFPKALTPNYEWVPIAYHGRSSSVMLSGTPVLRPSGQVMPPEASEPLFMKSQWLDYEFEMGYFIGGKTNNYGETIQVDKAEENIFGLVILNDWSARDIQAWEYIPLGPFNSKNFLTTISPWVVTLEALKEFKTEMPQQSPTPLPYLQEKNRSIFDVNLETHYKASEMENFQKISSSNLKELYWSLNQQVTHHTETGCNLRPGDLMGTGTISGTTKDSAGSLLEMSEAAKVKIPLPVERFFLQDGDTVKFTAFAQGKSFRVGFGECTSCVQTS